MTALHSRHPDRCARLRAQRRTLMLGCALGTALALGTAAQRAGAQAFDSTPTTAFGAVTYDRATPGVETVQIESNTAVIDWRPIGTPVGEYLFLPGGNVATFQNGPNNSNFVVLNRIVTTLPSRFDGTVLSLLNDTSGGSAPGGTVLFSGPGGIIVGAGAVFDVGNLVLTSLDVVVDGAGNFITADGGFQFVGGAARADTAIVTEAGSQILASPDGSYVAFVAPRIVHGGSVTVNGSAGYLAGEEAEFSVSEGLFDIIVPVGSDNPDPIVHTGSTGGPASTGGTDNHRIYMVAVPKNQAITALLSGDVGFDAATDVTVENGAIILSAGYNRILPGDFVDTSTASAQDASFLITGGTVTSDLTGFAVTDMFASGETASLAFEQDVSLFGGERARLFAANGETVTVGGDAVVSASRSISSDGSPDVTGGEALVSADSGGTLVVSGDLEVTASGYGASGLTEFGDGTGGTASLVADDGEVRVSGNVVVTANGTGESSTYTGVPAGQGIGGTASVAASGTGLIVLSGDLGVQADGNGGTVQEVAAPGVGSGGNAGIQALGDSSIAVAGNVLVSAAGTGGIHDFGDVTIVDPVAGADALGGTAGASTGGSGEISIDGNLTLDAGGTGSDGTAGGAGGGGEGGEATVSVQGGSVAVASLQITVAGLGGSAGDAVENTDGTPNAGGAGGEGRGGTAAIAVGPDGTLTVDLATLNATGTGGAGGDGSSLSGPGGQGGSGGGGAGGTATVGTTGGAVLITSSAGIDLFSGGVGGAGGDGGAAPGSQPGGDGGAGGAGTAGSSAVDVAGGSVTTPFADLESGGTGGSGGAGGANAGQPGSAGANGSGTGGLTRISVADAGGLSGSASLGTTALSASAVGGSGSVGTGDVAGRIVVEDLGTVSGGLTFASLTASSTGAPAAGGSAFELTSDEGPIVATGDVSIDVEGDVSFAAAGSGGLDAAGSVSVLAGGSILLDHDAPVADAATVSGGAVAMQAGAAISGTEESLIEAVDGDVLLVAATVDTGRVAATADVLVEADTIALDDVAAGRDVLLEADGDVDVGVAQAGDDFRATAGGAFTGGTIVATGLGPDSDGDGGTAPDGSNIIVDADGDIRLDDGTAAGAIGLASANGSVAGDGLLSAGTDLDVSAAGNVALTDAQAGGEIVLAAAGNLVAGELTADGAIDVDVGGSATITDAQADGEIVLAAAGDLVAGGLTAGGAIDVIVGGSATIASAGSGASIIVDAAGDLRLDDGAAAGSISLTSADGGVASDGLLAAGTDLDIAAGADIAINDAEAGGAIGLAAAGDLDAGDLTAGGDIMAFADGAVAIASGDSGGSIGVTAAAAAMLGTFVAAQDIGVAAAGIALTSASAGRDVSLASGADVDVGTAEAGDDFSAVAAGTFAADRVDATGAGSDNEAGSATLGGAGNIMVEADGDLRLDNADAAGDVSLASTSGSISSSGVLISRDGAFTATADSDFVMGGAAVLSAGTADITAGGDAMFNLVAAQTFTAAVGGTATFGGNVDSETIDVTSSDIEIMADGSLGADITETVSLTVLATGEPTVVGGSDQGPGYTLTDAEANRITTALLRVRAPQTGTDPGRDPDLVVRDLSLTGERIGQLELLTTGIMEVGGALLLSDVRTDGGILLGAAERLQVVTPDGSVRVRDGAGMPGGTLALESSNIWSASRTLIDQLAADPNFAGRNDALLANDGPVEPRGHIEAADVALRAGETLFVQNSGDAGAFAGITVVGNSLTITPTGDAPLVVYAFGRRLAADGSFVTNDQFFAEVVFEDRGGTVGYTDESEFNRCVINTGVCPAVEPETGLDIPEGPDIIEEPIGGLFNLAFPDNGGDDLVDTTFSADPLIEQPVTSGGDSILWDCDMDGDGDCDEDD